MGLVSFPKAMRDFAACRSLSREGAGRSGLSSTLKTAVTTSPSRRHPDLRLQDLFPINQSVLFVTAAQMGQDSFVSSRDDRRCHLIPPCSANTYDLIEVLRIQ